MQLTTGNNTQLDIFGLTTELSEEQPKKRRSRNTISKQRTVEAQIKGDAITLPNGESTVVRADDGIIVRHHNASEKMPDHMLMLNHEYDPEADDLVLNWTDENIQDLWDGMLNEHLKMLRQTKPGSATREEILEWQESESFKELCAAIAYRPDDIRDGVIEALHNYDFISQTRDIIAMLTKLDQKVVQVVEEAGLSRRECNSRRFKDQMADWFLSQFRKVANSKTKWEKIQNLMLSDELRDLANQIGLDMSGVINRIKPKLYFIQNPSEVEFDI
ncbi:TPA: hypothetical protein ACGSTL_001326 [Vibrio parahaemolyticus]|jgi:hypothetical protein|uniref:hypothetical protein n=1 Tax=Vibrio campbellii TaxID=680 RepID=UPI001F075A3A|nr:hypothetical protein [Vibrio campbellii]UMM06771.1 hypothetical protein MKR81_26285 [Vibrio campbellii]